MDFSCSVAQTKEHGTSNAKVMVDSLSLWIKGSAWCAHVFFLMQCASFIFKILYFFYPFQLRSLSCLYPDWIILLVKMHLFCLNWKMRETLGLLFVLLSPLDTQNSSRSLYHQGSLDNRCSHIVLALRINVSLNLDDENEN